MVRRWWRVGGERWRGRLAVNGIGALATGVVAVVIAVTKFTHGAWIVIIVIPLLVLGFLSMRRHYDDVATQLSLERWEGPAPMEHTVLVLVGDVHRGVVRAVQYARTLATTAQVRAVFVDDRAHGEGREKWGVWGRGAADRAHLAMPILIGPFLQYVDALQTRNRNLVITVVCEFIPRRGGSTCSQPDRPRPQGRAPLPAYTPTDVRIC
jgi:hypothetical protein